MKRSIVFLNRVMPPAEGATGQLLLELARELVKAGWNVTVVTSRPPGGKVASEEIDGVRIERVGGLPFTRISHWRRALSYLSVYPALLWRAWRLPQADIVFTLTDPPMLLLLGPFLKWAHAARLVHWAQDLYPELAEELGVLRRDGWIARLLRSVSTWALVRSDAVIAVGRCMKSRIERRGVPSANIEVIPNWGTTDASSGNQSEAFRQASGWSDRFVVMYSGNFGLAHPFGTILDAAELLAATDPDVLFVFIGEGPGLPAVRERVAARRLGNVQFLPFQPRERLGQSLGAADVHLATMREELCGLVVPSKVYGALAAGRPCVFLGPIECEAARMIRQEGVGSVLTHVSGRRLADCLLQWKLDPLLRAETQQRLAAIRPRVGLDHASEAVGRRLEKLLAGSRERVVLEPAPKFGDYSN